MKIIVRALALGMLLTGFAADHYLSAKTTQSTNVTVASTAGPGGNCGSLTQWCAN
jgi:hypothetical protein